MPCPTVAVLASDETLSFIILELVASRGRHEDRDDTGLDRLSLGIRVKPRWGNSGAACWLDDELLLPGLLVGPRRSGAHRL
jgi:hypothetical protein